MPIYTQHLTQCLKHRKSFKTFVPNVRFVDICLWITWISLCITEKSARIVVDKYFFVLISGDRVSSLISIFLHLDEYL